MYQSIVKQKHTSKQSDESNQNFLSGGKGSFIIETIQENSASTSKQQPKIKPRDLSSPYSQSLNQNNLKKKKIQSQSVEKYNYKQKKATQEKPWKAKQKNIQTQEEDNKDLQTTGFSDLKSSQNNLQINKEQFKRSTNSPTQLLFSSSKQNQQQLTSSVEYSTNHLHNISITTTTTAASRGNSRISKNTQHSNKKNQNIYQTTNTIHSKSPKCYQSPNHNSGSINPWNINASRKLNLNQLQEDNQQESQSMHQKNIQRTQELSPENNRSQNKDSQSYKFTGGITSGLLRQKSIQSPTDIPLDSKKNREIQSANFDAIKEKSVKGIKHNYSQNKQMIERATSQNINAAKKANNQKNAKPTSETRIDPSTKLEKVQKNNKDHVKQQTTKPQKQNASIQSTKQTKNSHQNNLRKETFNKKLNQKIQQKKFERSSNDINSASDTEYFEMSQKFSTIGDPRLFQIEHFIGGQVPPNAKQESTNKQQNPPKPQLKYPNFQSEQKNQKRQSDKINNGYNQPILDDEIEENIETESKHSLNNSPKQQHKVLQQEVEIEEIVDVYEDNQQHCANQAIITKDFKDSHKISCIPQLNHLTMSNVMQKETQEGHDGDHEDNSGDYTDYEKQKKINSTGLSFTKPNLAVKKNESYASDLQKTQEKIFQKFRNPNSNNNNNNPYQNFVTQEEQIDQNHSNQQLSNQKIEELQEDDLNQSQTRFLKDQISNMMIQNFRPFTPPFNHVCQMTSSNLRQKKDSIFSNHSTSNKHSQNYNQMQKQESLQAVNQSSISSHRDENEIELFYDDILNCYYDPKTNQYYELKA
ncbi:hypothetical protein ABPG72_012431 [Tetrahymena utriculariae]